MLFATTEELELQGISCKNASQIIFHNKLLTRASFFPKTSRKAAIKFCQEYSTSNLLCLIVESKSYLTVWIEEKNANLTSENGHSIRNFAKPQLNSSSSQGAKPKVNQEGTKNGALNHQEKRLDLLPFDSRKLFALDTERAEKLAERMQRDEHPRSPHSNPLDLSPEYPAPHSSAPNPSKSFSKEALSQPPPKHETSFENSNQNQNIDNVETPPDPPSNQKASSKKRPPRKYRGISY